MVFNVNGFNLKNIQIDIIKSKGINIVKKANLKSYIKGSIINFQINGIDNFNEYNFEFKLLASIEVLNNFKMNKNVKINEYIDENVIIDINRVLDSGSFKYCDFYLEKIETNIFKFNIYVKDYEFLSPKYNMFIEFLINYEEI